MIWSSHYVCLRTVTSQGAADFCEAEQISINRNHEIYSIATKARSYYQTGDFKGFIKLEPFLDECQGTALFGPPKSHLIK